MAENTVVISASVEKSIRILKWKVKEGFTISVGKIILLYDFETSDSLEQKKLKAVKAGKVKRLVVREGDIVPPGSPLLEIIECTHPTVMKDMCGECGADLRKIEHQDGKNQGSGASVAMVHSIPELKVSQEQALKIGREDSERLLSDRKLVLLVDLDQTLIHTTNDNVPVHLKNVHHFQLYGIQSPWYHTRLRPGTLHFLTAVAPMYELHICTFGARNYAHKIAEYLDKDQKFFSQRILSRDECFNATSKTANLKALFPCGDNMVCIIDDREDVWSHAPNLIHVKPYHFFQHTGDINAPPGLGKTDLDDTPGAGLDLSLFSKKKADVDDKVENVETKEAPEKVNSEESVKSDVIENLEKKEEQTMEVDESETSPDKIDKETETEDKTENSEKEEEEKVKEDAPESVEIKDIESNTNINSDDSKTETKPSDKKCNGKNTVQTENNNLDKKETASADTLVELDDPDDYLLYLEVILKNIHKTFYTLYDEAKNNKVPDLKSVIPLVKKKVLFGTNLVFSGLVPTHVKLEQSRAYLVAKSLGAVVTQDLTENTTHLVAVRSGTAKVNAGRRKKNICIVTPDWLWACAERWEWVEEQLFPLTPKPSKNRHPPPHCSSPEHSSTSDYGSYVNITEGDAQNAEATSSTGGRKRTASGRFMDSINPLLSFSSADIADMDKEVEDEIEDDSDSDIDLKTPVKQAHETSDEMENITEEKRIKKQLSRLSNDSDDSNSSSSSVDTLSGAEHPHGWGPDKKNPEGIKSFKRKRSMDDEGESTQEEFPDIGKEEEPEGPRKMLDMFYNGDSTGDSTVGSAGSGEPADEIDDGEWNMMGAALEREFLGLD